MAQIRIEVELDARGAVKGIRQLSGEMKKLPQAAADASRQLRHQTETARDAIDILAHQFGITLPREIKKFTASLPGVGAAFEKAFNASVIFFFIRGIAQAIVSTKDFQ